MPAMRFAHSLDSAWRHRLKAQLIACAALLLGVAGIVGAIGHTELDVDRIEGEGWSAEGVRLQFDLTRPGAAARATAKRLHVASLRRDFSGVEIECPALQLDGKTIACANASVALKVLETGAQRLRGRLAYDRRSGAIDMNVRAQQFAGGALRLSASLGEAGWRVHAFAEGIEVDRGLQLARSFGMTLPELAATGRISAEVRAEGVRSLQQAQVTATVSELTANNEMGTIASDRLSATAHVNVVAMGEGWDFGAEVQADQGQAYAEPVFLDLAAHALEAQARGRIEGGRIELQRFAVDHRDVLVAHGAARVDLGSPRPIRDLHLEVGALQTSGAYESYIQPFLLGTAFKSLKTSGLVSGELEVANGVPRRLEIELQDVTLDDGTKAFALEGLNGRVSWRESADEDQEVPLSGVARSQLSWRSGSLLNLALGAAKLQFVTAGRGFRLLEPAHVPILDGAIDLESLQVRDAGSPTVAFVVDAIVRPISVTELCRAFGWPEFGGSLGGVISNLRLRQGVVTLGTTLQAEVFGGRVAIRDLRMEDIFGTWPRLYSSIALDGLDLELLTNAFSFGRITGRLSGAIDDLQLFNWMPIAFDARLYTPPNDRSRHRISQRAVENIGSLGGGGAGITGALSSGFLRFFDEFNYERLGLSCRLQNQVCYMDGVAPAPNGGYYLVKGAGLPRIDVIGTARRVDWPRLVQQLIAATQSSGPVVE